MYGFWNLNAGTSGFYLPYILTTIGAQTQAASVALNAFLFVLGGLSVLLVFMPRRGPRPNRARAVPIARARRSPPSCCSRSSAHHGGRVRLRADERPRAAGSAQQQFFQLWSAEAFPTLLRATALGLMFAIVRIALGGWSLVLPTFLEAGFHGVAWTLIAFLSASALIGLAYARRVGSRNIR